MAITQHVINGSVSALKTALEATGFFESCVYDDESSPTAVLCYDADEHLLFKAESQARSGTNVGWRFTAYKASGTNASIFSNGSTHGKPSFLYVVGTKAAIIHFQESFSGAALLAFGKTTSGSLGFAIPADMSSAAADNAQAQVAAWDDAPDLSTVLQITDGTNPMVGNSTQLVPVPLHGAYGVPQTLETVFFIPMAQTDMRGVVQEITSADGKTYLGNGYIEAYDDGGTT